MKYISIIWNSLESIKQAEKLKAKYENEGYSLIHTSHGLNITTLTYKKL